MDHELWTVILCGGRGTRAYPLTEDLPKPLLEVAGIPVVEHVMGIYARRGFDRFLLAAGYMWERIAEHVERRELPWEVKVIDTGLDTGTGERLRISAGSAGPTFFATYADGLADLDLDSLLAVHRAHGALATVTTVPLPSQYGTLDIDAEERVRGFREKPRLYDHWINAGFFVFESHAFTEHAGTDLEGEVLPSLARAGQLHANRHTGFWRSLDTYKDLQELDRSASAAEVLPWL